MLAFDFCAIEYLVVARSRITNGSTRFFRQPLLIGARLLFGLNHAVFHQTFYPALITGGGVAGVALSRL